MAASGYGVLGLVRVGTVPARQATDNRRRHAMLAEPDLAVVERARRGDHAAFRVIVVAYQDKVHDLLARMLAGIVSLAEVEELAQETFVRVYRALPKFVPEGPGRLTRWVLVVATRYGIDVLRRRRLMTEPLDGAEPGRPALVANDAATHGYLAGALARAVASLPAPYRAAFVLRDHYGFEMEEIADVLDIEVGTVKSRLSRARAALRAALEDDHA
jgi:RNA polymerase sigma-70 factor (ECF subfamily)